MYNPQDISLEGMEIDWSTHPFAHYVQSQACGNGEYSEEQKKKMVAVYMGMVTYIDYAIGKVIDRLKVLGLYEDSIIIFCSDHGDFAGRYGLVAKTKAFYEPIIRIPLIMKLRELNLKLMPGLAI